MTPTIRTMRGRWIQLACAALLLLALLSALSGPRPAYAHDDDDDNEVVTTGPNVCTATANLPTYPNATCIAHEIESEAGLTETKNYYVSQDAAETVRRAYEAAFSQNGWTIVASEYDQVDQEWEYTIRLGQRRVEVTVEPRASAEGVETLIAIKE